MTIVPDRPWETREYARLRLNEVFANDLMVLLTEELNRLHSDRLLTKEAGLSVTGLNRQIRHYSSIRELVHGTQHERGWCACERKDAEAEDRVR